ncbi:eukaryotic translation initiation factor eIF2A-domain-containing protein [Gautieria morchelliformis]|nr:eukaryotic translation initiation factor eIF2A-domain-containing protein [Gautieria morchelliformis]
MASQMSQQYAFRSQKQLDLVGGTPSYDHLEGFQTPEETARTYQHSPDGKLFAYAVPTGVRIVAAEDGGVIQELTLPNVVELGFSPKATFLSTWERPVRLEDGPQHKNLRIFSVATGEEVFAITQKSQEGWNLQYTASESHAIRISGSEVQVFNPADWAKGVIDKLKVEGCTSVTLSPGLNPHIAVFVAEKKGAPAVIRIYGLLTLSSPPTSQKTFYKSDRATIKWNALGTQVLVLTQTEVDKTNKSYYGETGLYLLSAAGNFDCRVTLDKEGPISDFAWSPNSKEFGVVYGYMPAKAVLFDQRVRVLHDFGSSPINFISFNPQGRLILLAGFGNLAGKVDLYDRRSLTRVCTLDAPNTSWCEWSPDGKFILTATLSPRLRVDNGIKVWHCTGPLVHVHMIEELYQASWRPIPVDDCPPFGQNMPVAPVPSASALEHATSKPPPSKPAGAYRPPGARGLAAPSIFKREDEGGVPHRSSNGMSTPPRGYTRSPVPGSNPNGNSDYNGKGGRNGRKPHVPGAPTSPPPGDGGEKRGKQKRKKKDGREAENGASKAAPPSQVSANGTPVVRPATPVDNTSAIIPVTESASLDPIAKKVRNLNKKIKAIEELKEKTRRGERLEATQLKKMDTEAEIKRELEGLMLASAAIVPATA